MAKDKGKNPDDEEEEDSSRTNRRNQENATGGGVTLDPAGLLGSLGTIVSWGFWGLLIGGIVVAAAGPIGALIGTFSKDGEQGFHDFIDGLKLQLNGMMKNDFFDISEERMRDMATTERLQGQIADALEAQKIAAPEAAELAKVIMPDDAARADFFTFVDSQGLSIKGLYKDASQLMQPARLQAMIERSPRILEGVVDYQIKAGAKGGTMPDIIKGPLKAAIENGLLTRPEHQNWITKAVSYYAQSVPPEYQSIVASIQQDPVLLRQVITRALDGVSGTDLLAGVKLPDSVNKQIEDKVRAEILNDPAIAPIFAAVIQADPSAKAELDAIKIDITNPDKAAVKTHILMNVIGIIAKDGKRIAGLTNVTDEQFSALLDSVGLKEDSQNPNQSIQQLRRDLMHKETRAAVIGLLSKLPATKGEGDADVFKAVMAMATGGKELNGIDGLLGSYVKNSPERKAAFNEFATELERIGKTRGGAEELRYNTIAGMVRGLTNHAEQIVELSIARDSLPQDMQPLLAQYTDPKAGPQALLNLLVDQDARAELNTEHPVLKRRKLFILGDAISKMDASTFAGGEKMLTWLTTKQGDTYPNLQLLVNEAEKLDNATGMGSKEEMELRAKPAEQWTDTDRAFANIEVEADKEVLKLAGVAVAAMQGTLTVTGSDGPYPVYSVPVTYEGKTTIENVIAPDLMDENKGDSHAFGEAVHKALTDAPLPASSVHKRVAAPTLNAIGDIVRGMDTSAFLKQHPEYKDAIATLQKNFFNDSLGKTFGVPEKGEGAAAALTDTDTVAVILMQLAEADKNKDNSPIPKPWLASDDLSKLIDIANAFKAVGAGKAQQVAEVENPRTPDQTSNMFLGALFGFGA